VTPTEDQRVGYEGEDKQDGHYPQQVLGKSHDNTCEHPGTVSGAVQLALDLPAEFRRERIPMRFRRTRRHICYPIPMSDDKGNRRNLDAQLADLLAQINDLVRRLETAAEREAEALRPKLKAAQERLAEIQQTSAEAWQDLKPGIEKAWDELQKSLNQAASRFKSRPPKV
jgi:hypothetical protein